MKGKVVFRADGGEKTGLGHLIRCYAIAEMVQNNFNIEFACIDIPGETLLDFEKKGMKVNVIKDDKELLDLTGPKTVVVLDGYNFPRDYQEDIRRSGSMLVCIDDWGNTESVADILINHAPEVTSDSYKVLPHTIFALGIEYAMLRKEFLGAALNTRRRLALKNILICFGGADPTNISQKVLENCISNHGFEKINVVTGNSYTLNEALLDLSASDTRVHVYQSLDQQQMFKMMAEADLAIVPASGMLFEAIACGCFIASGCYLDNQRAIYQGFKKMNAFFDLTDFSELSVLETIDVKDFSGNRTGLIDGKSGERINRLFLQSIQ
ncbi:MAG: UDP-2,4-diacetamido-2,4,6-trideoxy-beta-L-altropyranose hydrolase [Ginsengibacter sp.]